MGPLRGKGVWKIPTGLVDAVHTLHSLLWPCLTRMRHQGEDIADACVRECREETGVEDPQTSPKLAPDVPRTSLKSSPNWVLLQPVRT